MAQIVLSSQFGLKVSALGNQLVSSQRTAGTGPLPIPPVMRAFAMRNGGQVGGPLVVQMIQDAEMRLKMEQPFFSLNASQLSGTREPGFVWQAKGTMNSVMPLQVIDSYVDGTGALEVRIVGSIPVASSMGGETDRGEAMRFLAELPWNPDAILNARGLTWRVIDEESVEVSLETSNGVARVTLQLDEAGDIIAIEAAERPRAGDTPARWIGRFSNYAQVGAYRFPRHGEIAWDLPQGEFIYWRGDILRIAASAS